MIGVKRNKTTSGVSHTQYISDLEEIREDIDTKITSGENIHGVTPTEMGYLSGITSSVQTQLDDKLKTGTNTLSNTTTEFNQTGGTDYTLQLKNSTASKNCTLDIYSGHSTHVDCLRIINLGTTGEGIIKNRNTTDLILRSATDKDFILHTDGTITTDESINGASPTEMGYLSGVTSSVQTQIDTINANKEIFLQPEDGLTDDYVVQIKTERNIRAARLNVTGNHSSYINGLSLRSTGTGYSFIIHDGDQDLCFNTQIGIAMAISPTGEITSQGNVNGASPTEMGYLSGVTSAIQTQLDILRFGVILHYDLTWITNTWYYKNGNGELTGGAWKKLQLSSDNRYTFTPPNGSQITKYKITLNRNTGVDTDARSDSTYGISLGHYFQIRYYIDGTAVNFESAITQLSIDSLESSYGYTTDNIYEYGWVDTVNSPIFGSADSLEIGIKEIDYGTGTEWQLPSDWIVGLDLMLH